ncbi:MAG: Tad domain-containing protein [Anaerolineae bacterium]|nr:Tad domain-containing protein [Anaerolineae bacterium]
MLTHLREKGESGQAIILFALAMVGIVAVVAVALDGGMLYWNQRRAQNAADAAVIAGTSALVTESLSDSYICGVTSDQSILDQVHLYAGLNDVPNPAAGNVEAYYLIEDGEGNRIDMPNPAVNGPWQVGYNGTVPCAELVGLHVRIWYPQQTFISGIIGIEQTRVMVDAYATWDHRNWCTDFAMFSTDTDSNQGNLSSIGAGTTITNGGIHSNGGIHLGGGGQNIYLEPGRPIEYGDGSDANFDCDKIVGGPDPDAEDCGITGTDPYPLPDDFFYRFEDFAPGGFIWEEAGAAGIPRFYFGSGDPDVGVEDVRVSATQGSGLVDGLYVVEGDVDLQNVDRWFNEADGPWRVTIVARGEVKISGGMISQVPAVRGIFIFTLSDDMNNGAVNITGDDNSWMGLIAAPNGFVNIHGANNNDVSGMIIGRQINVSGSDININHRPEFCPPNPPRILLVQ